MIKSVKYMLRELDDFDYLIENRYNHPESFRIALSKVRKFIESITIDSIKEIYSNSVYEMVSVRVFLNVIKLCRMNLPTSGYPLTLSVDMNKFYYVLSLLLDTFLNELKYELWDRYNITFLDYERENYPSLFRLYMIEKHLLN